MIVVVAQYTGLPGSADAIRKHLTRMAELVKESEPGCLAYKVAQATDRSDDWLLYEVYVDEAALAYHRETAHFREIILDTVVPLLEERRPRTYIPVID